MRKLPTAAIAVAVFLLTPAWATEGSQGFGRTAYAYGFQGSQFAYQAFLVAPNGYTQAATAWGYYGQLYASYGMAADEVAGRVTYYPNAEVCFRNAMTAANAAYGSGSSLNNQNIRIAAAYYAVAVAFALQAESGF